MAGIGFKLQRLLVEEMYLSLFKGFFFSLIITSGPWLIMVISLAVLSILSGFFLVDEHQLLFNILLIHIFSSTIIITGTFQLFFTRIFADKMYTKEREELSVIILTNLAATLCFTCLLSIPFLYLVTIDFSLKLLVFGLTLAMNFIWVLMNYISASEDFLGFIKHYLIGSAAGILLGATIGYASNFSGFFAGFFLGQIYVAITLIFQSIKIFGLPDRLDVALFRKNKHYSLLIFSGFFLYAGMWVDKFIYWYGPDGSKTASFLYYNSGYNDIFYICYLFTTPIMALFFITMETTFYKKYYAYNKAVTGKATLDQLRRMRDEITDCIKTQLNNIVRIQSLIIILGVLFSEKILALFKIDAELTLLFTYALIGVFFHMLFLIICVILLYFDLRKETMKIYANFLVLNFLLTIFFYTLPSYCTGLGYTIGAFLVFMHSIIQLKRSLTDMNYLSFTRHAMAEEKMEEIFLPESGGYGRYYIKNGEKIISHF